MTNSQKDINYFSTSTPLESPLPKWGENPLIYTWIQDKQLIITIHFPLNLSLKILQHTHFSLNLSLLIRQQILDEIFSPHFHNPLLEVSLDYFLQILKRWRKNSGKFWILLGWKLKIYLHYKSHINIWDIYEKYINL